MKYSFAFLSLLFAGVAFGGAGVERTPTGVRLVRDGAVAWNFEIATPEGRPFFHPLTLPGGRSLTAARPTDHVWHLGYWFSWKFINGVNYWEPADAERKGCEPAGATRVVKEEVKIDGEDCTVDLRLEYGPRGASPVLAEKRRIVIDPPDAKGGYTITTRHTFTALADVTLDRSEPWGSVASGKWGAGYAGMTLRLADDAAAALAVRGYAGGTTPGDCTARETTFLDFTDPATGEGVTFTQLKAPPSARFYLWPDKRMINPSVVYTGPLTLKKGETLELAYRLAVHGDRRVTGGLAARPEERMDDGLIAGVTAEGTHVSWRWLDKKAYDLWRRVNGTVEKLTREPIVQTSDLFLPGYTNLTAEYSLDGKTFTPVRCTTENDMTFVRIPLADTNATVQATAVGDLNGDGAYDYVVKTPQGNIDPWELVWHKSDSTYKLEAHDSSGALLWIRDLGWNIEQGIWYSPFLVADLDGDGRAEVIAKTAPTDVDYRDADGRVHDGPEPVGAALRGQARADARRHGTAGRTIEGHACAYGPARRLEDRLRADGDRPRPRRRLVASSAFAFRCEAEGQVRGHRHADAREPVPASGSPTVLPLILYLKGIADGLAFASCSPCPSSDLCFLRRRMRCRTWGGKASCRRW